MISRISFTLWCLGILTLLIHAGINHGIPLGFDNGAYRHFVHVLVEVGSIEKIPLYLQQQFEPFSGVFFFTLFQGIPEKYVFSWGYISLMILISTSLFFLGKKGNRYTTGAYLGLFLFTFSVLQYINFWWGFGKQMFATFFLLLLIKYYKNIGVSLILLSACIALHRLTGFIAILFVIFSFLEEKNMSKKWPLLGAILIALGTYMPTISLQVIPYFLGKIQNYVFLSGTYGTGLEQKYYWMYEIPLIVFVGYIYIKSKYHLKKNDTHVIVLLWILCMVVFRCIAHTRLESFIDLFLIIFVVKNSASITKKIGITFILIQFLIGFIFIQKWHTPFIDKTEQEIIKNTFESTPKNVTIVTLTGAYMSMITPYTNNEIYSTYQGVSSSVFSNEDRIKMRDNKFILCKNLSHLPAPVFVYVGMKEKFTSTKQNPCLKEIKSWDNTARLLFYTGKR